MAEDLRGYTCDAMAGQDIHSDHKAMNQAKKKVKEADIVFTTCIGAGVGLLRSEEFDIVIVDEASQQTEPASLVPLVKGCSKAILVGDHVQLRPTVEKYALAVGFDVSLFERLYTGLESEESSTGNRVDPEVGGADHAVEVNRMIRKLMLDTQYRMHPQVCQFSSKEFYEGKLKTGITRDERPLLASQFPWPAVALRGGDHPGQPDGDHERMLFIECETKEKPGQKSKENEGQARPCAHICKLLTTPAPDIIAQGSAQLGKYLSLKAQSIAVLTPYTRQAELLRRLLANLSEHVEISSIDGFQGREADIVVFVTVRCNEHREIGFLKDLRRMNVALTRAKAGLVVIGNGRTLTEGTSDPESAEMWKRLLGSLTRVNIVVPEE